VIREPVEALRSLDGELARGVEREEPDPRLVVEGDVGADVQLGKERDSR
jgi:hypothetical protein